MRSLAIKVQEACAVMALWQTGQFDTMEIANLLAIPEPVVCRVIHIAREAAREQQ